MVTVGLVSKFYSCFFMIFILNSPAYSNVIYNFVISQSFNFKNTFLNFICI